MIYVLISFNNLVSGVAVTILNDNPSEISPQSINTEDKNIIASLRAQLDE